MNVAAKHTEAEKLGKHTARALKRCKEQRLSVVAKRGLTEALIPPVDAKELLHSFRGGT